ncbi:CHAD domain-containing protein [Methylobacterium sp. J-068]|uniref:CYTH and CHAD domain-containing protein n=1 Tax=Methylobacterium sp. J-068 TaxID=2836649 RepID=UPI001FBA86AE|nr:CHAD domain-containing protein [Methylobacterium sp. J-068]MCJ2035328.1 CHAD domain-containing protein [Methylobacterium sp. J-068]
MDAPREIELKLQCEAGDLAELARHPFLQAASHEQSAFLTSTYHDTPDGDLRKAGLTLRVRRAGDAFVQTVKVASKAAGLFDRAEWEGAIPGDRPDLAQLGETPLPALLETVSDPSLVPVFATLVERRSRSVSYGASRIEVAFDEGRIQTPSGDAPLWELELELKAGEPEDLFTLAQALSETVPLRLGALSKSARGFSLIDGTLRRPSKAGPVHLGPEATAGDAFRAIAQACTVQLRLNEDVFLHDHDPEALHQLRVALRRLRSAFTLFKPVLAGDATAGHLREEIKRITEPFGHARNLDVFLGETLPAEVARRPDEPGLDDLRARLEAERSRAYDAVLSTLESPEWRGLVLELASWLETGTWRTLEAPERDRAAADYAADVLDKARKRIRKRGRHLDRLDPEARHRVRIEAKKLRYGADFFASLFTDKASRKRHKAFASALSDLQDHLGALNDQATAHAVLASLTVTPDHPPVPSETLFAAGLAAGDNEANARKLLKAAAEAHGELLDVKPFWR